MPRKSPSSFRARSASRKPAAPRSTSSRAPAATRFAGRLQHHLHAGQPVRREQRRLPRPAGGRSRRSSSDHDISAARSADRSGATSSGSTPSAATQGIHKLPVGVDFWPNLHEGKWGYNYQPDRSQPSASSTRTSGATSTPASPGRRRRRTSSTSSGTSRTSARTRASAWCRSSPRPSRGGRCRQPNRLQQVSWTNPFTNKLLFEAGLTAANQHYDTTQHREYQNPRSIPRVIEIGDTAGGDSVAPRVNQFAGAGFFALTSGSLNSAINEGGAERRNAQSYRTRASASYVTGAHNAKFGYEGGYFTAGPDQPGQRLAAALQLRRGRPPTCAATNACGNTSLQFPEDPNNLGAAAGPEQRGVQHRCRDLNDRVMYAAFYAQDQWTLSRLTLNGALRYDHATSGYGETCVGPNSLRAGAVQRPEQLLHARDRWRQLQRHHAALGCRLRHLRHRPDVGEMEHGQVPHGRRHQCQQHLRQRQPGAPHRELTAAQLERHRRRPHRRLRSDELHAEWRVHHVRALGRQRHRPVRT